MRELIQAALPRVVLDMSRVAFLDSSGLGAVVAVMKLLAPDRKLELSGLTPTVEKVFRLTRMDSIFTIHACPGRGPAECRMKAGARSECLLISGFACDSDGASVREAMRQALASSAAVPACRPMIAARRKSFWPKC